MHALDGCRMAVLGYKQHAIQEMIRLRNLADTRPVFDSFMDGLLTVPQVELTLRRPGHRR